MKILLIWEMIPESCKTYVLDVNPDEWQWMKLCHDCFGNTTHLEEPGLEANKAAVDRLSEYLVSKEPTDSSVSHPTIVAKNISFIIHSGYIL